MEVYVCYRSGSDDSNEPFAVCSNLEKCKQECINELMVYTLSKNKDSFLVKEIEDSSIEDIKFLTIIERQGLGEWHEYEIWKTNVK